MTKTNYAPTIGPEQTTGGVTTATKLDPKAGARTLWNAPARIGAAVFAVLVKWQARHDARAALRTMDRHLLDDVGITPSQAWEEARKPFWLP